MPAGRPVGTGGVRLTDEHRTKIQKSKILNRLISHAEGAVEMKPTEVTAALGLLKKALPDLQNVQLDGRLEHEAGDSIKSLMAEINGRTRTK